MVGSAHNKKLYSISFFAIVLSMNSDNHNKCIRCEGQIDDELVFCFKCGSPHHRSCFERYRQCAKSACRVSVYVANDGSGTVECLNLPERKPDSKAKYSPENEQAAKEPTMVEMTAALLFAFVVFVLVSLLLQAR